MEYNPKVIGLVKDIQTHVGYNDHIRPRTIEIKDPVNIFKDYQETKNNLRSEEKKEFDEDILRCANEVGLRKEDVMKYITVNLEEKLNETDKEPGTIGEGEIEDGFLWSFYNKINKVFPDRI